MILTSTAQTEAQIMTALFDWARREAQRVPLLGLLYHIPNEGKRHPARARREGIRAGVPDVCLPVPRRGCGALYIELKAKGKKPTDAQMEMIERLKKAGNAATWVDSLQAATEVIKWYMGIG